MANTNSVRNGLLALAFLSLNTAVTTQADDAPAPNQKPASDRTAMVAFGLGPSAGGIIGVVSFQTRRGTSLVGVRIASSSEFQIFGPFPSLSDTDYGLLYGRYRSAKAGYFSASAGVSMVSSVRRGRFLSSNCDSSEFFGCFLASPSYEKVVTRTVGIPFEAKAVLSGKHAGLGLTVIGNLNSHGSFVGAALTVELGSLR